MRISIIVAAFNEEDSIRATLEDLRAHLPPDREVLVVDGGQDRTGEIMREARGRVQAQIDADGQFLARDLAGLIAPIERGECDVTLGTRFVDGSGKDEDAPWSRNLGNVAVSAWVSLMCVQQMTDVLAGIKAWSAEVAEAACREAVRLGSAQAVCNLVLLLIAEERLDDAAAAMRGRHAGALHELGVMFGRAGRHAEAARYFAECLKVDAGHPTARMNLERARRAAGE